MKRHTRALAITLTRNASLGQLDGVGGWQNDGRLDRGVDDCRLSLGDLHPVLFSRSRRRRSRGLGCRSISITSDGRYNWFDVGFFVTCEHCRGRGTGEAHRRRILRGRTNVVVNAVRMGGIDNPKMLPKSRTVDIIVLAGAIRE